MERYRSHPVWEAWTDFGSVGVGRRAILRKSDKFSQTPSHPAMDPAAYIWGTTGECYGALASIGTPH